MEIGDVQLVWLAIGVAVGVAAAFGVLLLLRTVRTPAGLGTTAERATFATLHTASLAAPHLREGLGPAGAARAVRHLRALLGASAVAITDSTRTLAWDGPGESRHRADAVRHAAQALTAGRVAVLTADHIQAAAAAADAADAYESGPACESGAVGQGGAVGESEAAGAARGSGRCDDPECPIGAAVVAPITSGDEVVGALLAYAPAVGAGLARAVEELARWVSTQVELAELEASRTRAVEAELRALRAQISPHFIYNSLAAIASFVRTDPERARELVLEFADFTRYAFRRSGEFTTLADELRNVERYLALEKARFGDRLAVQILVAPEVLPVVIPFLAVQPLVENAVRHGIEGRPGVGHVSLGATDDGAAAHIWVEDDGAGSDPEVVRRILAGAHVGESVGLGNVDARLRSVFGDECGLVVETALGAGTKVSFRVPKFAPGVQLP
ncbi:sensor histidine kinase [Pseudofrankia asymbiotica]|uniref:sensor histidine kinase n=1 Tax=Pseudofrankia asymbiotica TaxID=1834516 RepID=UPI000976DF6D|nr:histidine kinase [Pseudofrankia asymbiotica]